MCGFRWVSPPQSLCVPSASQLWLLPARTVPSRAQPYNGTKSEHTKAQHAPVAAKLRRIYEPLSRKYVILLCTLRALLLRRILIFCTDYSHRFRLPTTRYEALHDVRIIGGAGAEGGAICETLLALDNNER